ncbi:MAG: AAA family ATPase [Cyanobacteria bacterium P01_G01_bin.54]
MLNLTGYQETEHLYTGTRTFVYRALRLGDDAPVIVKVLQNPHPHFNELVQFRNQYVITQNLDSPFIVKPLALERYDNGYALVMPDQGAVSLSSYWQGAKQELSELLWIAIQLAAALHVLAGQQIIHKDIKPANILIHPQTKQVQLIDFSIASLLPKEQRQLLNPKDLEGTLAYIAPEQTGRMNRGIDYRTDFYALGVTLYELLVGIVPFTHEAPLDLIHAHITQTPLSLSDLLNAQGQPHPPTLSAIIMKLMAKNAEDRYQSALGLKHDLERCLQSLEETGVIADFKLGERDLCDRFLLPEKLYGRDAEVQTMLVAFERVSQGSSELLLVVGYSGVGKTAVVNEVHKPIVRQRGYFIKGKFDQFNRTVPFSAFVQAFRSLMTQLLGESDAELQQWKTKILTALGESGQVLIAVIPELERVIGEQPPAPELSGVAAQNRFNSLLEQFIAVFTAPEHPLVMFLDDLQWADSASLNLMKVLVSNQAMGYLLLLGTYRDNEVFPAHPLMLTLAALEQQCQERMPRAQKATISTLTLAPLAEQQINQLVAATLSCSLAIAQPLTELIYRKTQGNPFFTTQFLKGLYDDGLLTFGRDLGYWQCDLAQVRNAALTDDVVAFMAGRLLKLPPTTQVVLQRAACIGNQFDLEILAIIQESSPEDVAADLWAALQEELVVPINQAYKFFQGEFESSPIETATVDYRFLHDRVQQAAYSLIDEAIKPETHLKLGRLLLKELSDFAIKENIFEVTNQLNLGYLLIGDRQEKHQLAHLNYLAGQRAKSSTAYWASIHYLELGIAILEDSWEHEYDLLLSLYLELIESEYINTNFERSKTLADIALNNAKTTLDQSKISELKIQYYIAKNERKQAVDLGISALKLLDIQLDQTEPNVSDIEALADLPEMRDPTQMMALRILITTVSAAVIAAPELLIPIAFTMVNLCIRFGNSTLSPYAYGFQAWMLCGFLAKIDRGYRFGKLAIQSVEKFNAKTVKCKVYQQFNVFVRHYKEPLKNMTSLVEAIQSGLEVGDIEYACYAAQDYCILQFFIGRNLTSAFAEQKKYLDLIEQKQQEFSSDFTSPWLQLVDTLLTHVAAQPGSSIALNGIFFDEQERLFKLKEENDKISLFPIFFIKLYLNYLFAQYPPAIENAIEAEQVKDGSSGFIYYPVYLFYHSLALLATAPAANIEAKNGIIERVKAQQVQFEFWLQHAPFTYQHKYDLVQAESYRVLDQKLDAIEFYDRAIAGAKENQYIQEEALANELAAKFYLNWGKEKMAATYMQDAYYCYARWGAKAKTDHLEAYYPGLLAPILQKQSVEFNSLDSLNTLTTTLTRSRPTQSPSSSTTISESLDFAAILQAAQKLASTIELEQLLGDIAEIILLNAAAQKMFLLTPNGQQYEHQWQLQVSAERMDQGNVISQTPVQLLTAESSIPIRLIQYVKNTQEPILISEAKTEIPGILEGYLLKHQPQSVLCVPLLKQGSLVAIAYLEHRTTKGVFTPNRQTIIEFLCAQAAVALQNAQLYQQAQVMLTELQHAQLQLVQSEKMSALGSLVAGVAHEINNPVGFLQGNIRPAQDYVRDLLELISLYQEKIPEPDSEIEAKIEAIDLEFVCEDLPKLLESMNAGVDRIHNISDSLRTFSRKDQDYKTAFNLHDGIESTLLILRHRTKASEKHPQVKIVKNYGQLPDIQCFPGQLNQVFMNVLANAIDAFDEANQDKTYQEIAANPNQIMITTLVKDKQVQIQIQDNGCGMKPETVERIFEQGFTTKGVGQGTGLGMAIAHQIITEKHGGIIECHSEFSQGTMFVITLPL